MPPCCKNLGIAGPAQPFVSLWAVGGDVEEVVFLSPHDVVVQLIEQRVRAGKLAGRWHVRMQHDRHDLIRRQRLLVRPLTPR
jgi:hypothetical protein